MRKEKGSARNATIVCSFDDLDLNRNATTYRDNHKHKDAVEIILHFINVKY